MAIPADNLPMEIDRNVEFNGEGTPDGSCVYAVSQKALKTIKETGPAWKYYTSFLLEEAISNPLVVFRGLKRQEFENGFCISAKPPRRYNNDGEVIPARKDRVLLVFVKRGMGLVAFDWENRPEEHKPPGHPVGWEDDFEEPVWRK